MIIFMLMFDTGELSCPDLQCWLQIIYLHFGILIIFFKILPFHIHNKYLHPVAAAGWRAANQSSQDQSVIVDGGILASSFMIHGQEVSLGQRSVMVL